MKEQLAIQTLMRNRYGELRAKNSSYSIRAFARKVGLNSGALSGIINGKRNVSAALARRICDRLMLDPQERMELLGLFPEKRNYQRSPSVQGSHESLGVSKLSESSETPGFHEGDERPLEATYLQLSAAQFRIVAEWQHFAILALMRTEGFSSDVHWIAKKLRLSQTKAEQAISRLISIGTVEKSTDGTLTRASKKFRTTDDIADVSVRRSHEENFDLLKASLERDSVKERDFTHDTLAIDPKNIGMAKELIRKFQDEFAKLVESGNRTEVYRLSMQFFPLSNLDNGDNPK